MFRKKHCKYHNNLADIQEMITVKDIASAIHQLEQMYIKQIIYCNPQEEKMIRMALLAGEIDINRYKIISSPYVNKRELYLVEPKKVFNYLD